MSRAKRIMRKICQYPKCQPGAIFVLPLFMDHSKQTIPDYGVECCVRFCLRPLVPLERRELFTVCNISNLLFSIKSALDLHLALKDRFLSLPLHKYITVHKQTGQKCHGLQELWERFTESQEPNAMEWYPFPPFSLLNMRAEFRGFQIRQRGAWNSDLDAFVIHIKMALTLACLSSEGQSISSSSEQPFRKLALSELGSIFEFHLWLLFNQSK